MTPARRPVARARDPWQSFRDNARIHLRDAENKLALLDEGANAKGVAADAVLAAIAYGDALTVQRLGLHNVDDHRALPDLVHRALGLDTVAEQVTRLRRIISKKNEAHYGGGMWSREIAEDYLTQVRRFANWAEAMLGAAR